MKYFDNTRISEYLACPRKFYFRHVRHWRREGVSINLAFGSGWHAAMDEIWAGKTIDEAVDAFRTVMDEEGIDLDMLDISQIRNPMTCRAMLENYVQLRAAFFDQIELLAVEQPFAVPLMPGSDEYYVGRIDKVFRHLTMKRICGGEHKTTSWYKKDGPFRAEWIASFSPNSQVDGYLYAGHMMYGEEFKSVWVDGALVHKTVHDGFGFIPCQRKFSMLDLWLWETNERVGAIQEDLNDLKKFLRTGLVNKMDYMPCFQRHTNSCFLYNRACSYLDICRNKPNPAQVFETPSDYIESKWQPFDELKLKELGLKAGEDLT